MGRLGAALRALLNFEERLRRGTPVALSWARLLMTRALRDLKPAGPRQDFLGDIVTELVNADAALAQGEFDAAATMVANAARALDGMLATRERHCG